MWKDTRTNCQSGPFLFSVGVLFLLFYLCIYIFHFILFYFCTDMREGRLRDRTWCRTVGIWLICLETALSSASDPWPTVPPAASPHSALACWLPRCNARDLFPTHFLLYNTSFFSFLFAFHFWIFLLLCLGKYLAFWPLVGRGHRNVFTRTL